MCDRLKVIINLVWGNLLYVENYLESFLTAHICVQTNIKKKTGITTGSILWRSGRNYQISPKWNFSWI